jgi:Leucine-rich repeat (LRR) protein
MQAELLPASLEEILMRSCGISVIICSPCLDPQHLMFPRLRTLNLSQNYLKDIPFFMMPPSLVTIDASNNFLTDVPATLASIHGLWNLFINENKVCSLPTWILELTALRRFSFSGNPILPSSEQKQLAANVQMSINFRELARQGCFPPFRHL